MSFTVSAVLLFGIAAFFAVRTKATGAGAALVVFLFGFFAAGTGAYEPIRDLVQATADAVSALAN
ncbi:hypothetical protein O7599_22905 [Streptomyces sp. WMMC500]|uniref:hypothetical protein n=1 Tax=Streptomyces sp. WMMC500 TaxID=3015154 RepID=UPI00248CBFB2|nr:hypothetical protein [Streptomyces sp. WMMC500]WBB58475.1 hypothetical protein O7599_22905 [Streptomyces sp. WMMC500]